MKLVIFNGSPRTEKSSTKILLDHFIKGFSSNQGNISESYFLRSIRDREMHLKKFIESEYVILGFPLYADSMPSFVKEFMEDLKPYRGKLHKLSIGFLVQSGFPEAAHSRPVERYLEKLTKRLGSKYMGTIIRGNCNRIDMQPAMMAKPVFKLMFSLGKSFGESGVLDKEIMNSLARPEKLKGFSLFLNRVLLKTPLATRYWDKQLKENRAFDKRSNAPYLKP